MGDSDQIPINNSTIILCKESNIEYSQAQSGTGFCCFCFSTDVDSACPTPALPPEATLGDDVEAFEDPDTSILVEAFYRYYVTDQISVTPGLVVVTNPEHNNNNSTNYIGVIRTVFDF